MLLAILFISAMQTTNETTTIYTIACPDGTRVVAGNSCPAPRIAPPTSYYATTVRGPFMDVRPKGNPGSWVTSDDYPTAALMAEKSGTVEFKLAVNKWGSVADCQITLSSGSADLDEATCERVAVRAKFYPATDKDSKPIAGTYSNRVRWVVPQDSPAVPVNQYPYLSEQADTIRRKEPQPFTKSGFVETEYVVSMSGTISECTETGDLFREMGEKETVCVEASRQELEPYQDEAGKPIEKKVKVRVTVEINDIK